MKKPGAPISPESQSDEVTMVVTQEVLQMKGQIVCLCHLHPHTEVFSDLLS